MDSPHSHNPEDEGVDHPAMPTFVELNAMLDQDETDVAAERIVPMEPVLENMRATAKRIRRERSMKEAAADRDA